MILAKLLLLSSFIPSILSSTISQQQHDDNMSLNENIVKSVDETHVNGDHLKRSLRTSSVTRVLDSDATNALDTRIVKCDANLITHEFALSQASCGWDTSQKVRIDSDIYDVEIIPSRAVYQHPSWNKADDSNDLVLIHLLYPTTLVEPDPFMSVAPVDNVSILYLFLFSIDFRNSQSVNIYVKLDSPDTIIFQIPFF